MAGGQPTSSANVQGQVNVRVLVDDGGGGPGPRGGGSPGPSGTGRRPSRYVGDSLITPGPGLTQAQANAAHRAMTKEQPSLLKNIQRGLGVIGIALTAGEIIRRSKIMSTTLSAILDILGALVDVLLMPLIPLIVKAIPALAQVVQWLMKFMDNPTEALKIAWEGFVEWLKKTDFVAIFRGLLTPDGILKALFGSTAGLLTGSAILGWLFGPKAALLPFKVLSFIMGKIPFAGSVFAGTALGNILSKIPIAGTLVGLAAFGAILGLFTISMIGGAEALEMLLKKILPERAQEAIFPGGGKMLQHPAPEDRPWWTWFLPYGDVSQINRRRPASEFGTVEPGTGFLSPNITINNNGITPNELQNESWWKRLIDNAFPPDFSP